MKNIIFITLLFLSGNSYSCNDSYPCILINQENEELFTPTYENIEANENKEDSVNRELSEYLLALSKSYIGAPYKYGGNDLTGIDCSSFTREIYKQMGIYLPRTSSEQFLDQRLDGITGDLRPFDLIFFKKSVYAKISHVAIYLGDGKMIHSSKNEGGVYVSEFKESGLWQRLFYKAKRLRKLTRRN